MRSYFEQKLQVLPEDVHKASATCQEKKKKEEKPFLIIILAEAGGGTLFKQF